MGMKYLVTKSLVINPVLKSWEALNKYIRDASQKQCEDLLQEELKGRARIMFVFRIHSRLNKVRADLEREQLRTKINEASKARYHRL